MKKIPFWLSPNFWILSSICVVIWLPLFMTISGSFMGKSELILSIGPVLNNSSGETTWPFLPSYPTLKPYVELLLDSPEFFAMFWNSCRQVFPIITGQILVAVPAAWAFSRFQFRFKKVLFNIYIILMLMPFQITMSPTYIVLDRLGIMDTHWAIIFPAVFSSFPVFIMERFFSAIPKALFEASEIDGANEFQIFFKIGVPLGLPGILSAILLGFLEYWNAIEQPLVFLHDKGKWPLSLYLPNITTNNASVSLAASVVMLTPALLLFLWGQKYLEQGIQSSGLKEY